MRRLLLLASLCLLPSALIAVACSSKTNDVAAPGSATDSGARETSVPAGDAAPVGDDAEGGTPDSSTWLAPIEDAAAPLDGDAGCPVALTLDPDAAPGTCEVSPADVACDAASDCTTLIVGHCSCIGDVYGVNRTSTAKCLPIPCPPPPPGSAPCGPATIETQDCHLANAIGDVQLACLNHQCVTYTP